MQRRMAQMESLERQWMTTPTDVLNAAGMAGARQTTTAGYVRNVTRRQERKVNVLVYRR